VRTAKLAILAFFLGAGISFTIAFPLRFLYVAYLHGGIF
jgi:hypothetical protein